MLPFKRKLLGSTYFPVALFNFKFGVLTESLSVTVKMKAIQQYFTVLLCKAVLIFESVDEIRNCFY